MPATSQYEIPDHRRPASQIHGWCLEAVSEGESWLKAQRPALEWERALQVLSEPGGDAAIDGLREQGETALYDALELAVAQFGPEANIRRSIVVSSASFCHVGAGAAKAS